MKNQRNNPILHILTALLLCAPMLLSASSPTPTGAGTDTLCNVWVYFKDKDKGHGHGRGTATHVSERSQLRRQRAHFKNNDSDRPINPNYVSAVERLGGTLRTRFPWGNAASFSVRASRLGEISSLPFVAAVTPVAVYIRQKAATSASAPAGLYRRAAACAEQPEELGGYDWHTEAVGVDLAHDYLRLKKLGNPGYGVLMAFFDSGFRLDHAAYRRVRDSSQVVAVYDFVDGDTLVHDPDSVAGNSRSPYYQNDKHGSQTLAFAAAYAPGVYLGTAWAASFALARTEDDAGESRVEEDNWAAAVLWADSLGAEIISSSLGYRDGYDDPAEDYRYPDMDGATTIISMAAAGAVERGIIVVNSMGNEGNSNKTPGTVTAPADVDGVVSVGAVTANRTLATFSSVGPTYDGRMKPEVVAPGSWVPVPDPYSRDHASYTFANGTSFSAPMVSAIMALILQANPGIGATEAKRRLYESCSFAYGQTIADNVYGYGIPSAVRAIMARDEIFLKVTDTAHMALAGAAVTMGAETFTADEKGRVLIRAKVSALPAALAISYRGSQALDTVKVSVLPFAGVVELGASRDDGLYVLPNVTKKNGVVRGKYTFSGTGAQTKAVATVRTLTGKKVWGREIFVRPDGSAEFTWDCKRAGVASGVYVVVVRQGYNVVSRKVVISN